MNKGSIEKVIELGESFDIPNFSLLRDLNIISLLFIFIAIMVILFAFVKATTKRQLFIVNTIVIALFTFGMIDNANTNKTEAEKLAIKDWQSVSALPYIAGLEKESFEVIKFIEKQSPSESSLDSNVEKLIADKDSLGNIVYGEVTYIKDDKQVKETGWFGFDISKEEKAELTYKVLTKDLGHKVNAGHYDKNLIFPIADLIETENRIMYAK